MEEFNTLLLEYLSRLITETLASLPGYRLGRRQSDIHQHMAGEHNV